MLLFFFLCLCSLYYKSDLQISLTPITQVRLPMITSYCVELHFNLRYCIVYWVILPSVMVGVDYGCNGRWRDCVGIIGGCMGC